MEKMIFMPVVVITRWIQEELNFDADGDFADLIKRRLKPFKGLEYY